MVALSHVPWGVITKISVTRSFYKTPEIKDPRSVESGKNGVWISRREGAFPKEQSLVKELIWANEKVQTEQCNSYISN